MNTEDLLGLDVVCALAETRATGDDELAAALIVAWLTRARRVAVACLPPAMDEEFPFLKSALIPSQSNVTRTGLKISLLGLSF